MSGHSIAYDLYESITVGSSRLNDPGSGGSIVLEPGISHGVMELVSAAAEARTLADPHTSGLELLLLMTTDGGDITVTCTSAVDENGATTLTFDDVGDWVKLVSIEDASGTYAWQIIKEKGVFDRRVAVGDANYTVLAYNSGKPHIVANVSADRTFTLPAEADGLDFEFIADVVAADGHDWIFDSGSNTNFFTGGVIHLDTDAGSAGDEVVVVASDGDSNSKLQINVPDAGTRVRFICNGTTWTVSGIVASATAPAFADQ